MMLSRARALDTVAASASNLGSVGSLGGEVPGRWLALTGCPGSLLTVGHVVFTGRMALLSPPRDAAPL